MAKIFDDLMVAANKAAFQMKKSKPELLMITGIAGIVVGGISLCHASMKVPDILEDTKEELEKVHEDLGTDEEMKKATTKVYFETGKKFVSIYAGPVILEVLAIGCMVGSNRELKKRNAALTTAYAALDKLYKEYRKRVVDRFGQDVDYELAHGIEKKEIEETVTDENGKEKKKKSKADIATADESMYMRYFTRSNPEWMNDDLMNIYKFECIHNYLKDKLRRKGFVILNEGHESFGFKEDIPGIVCGWVYDPKYPDRDLIKWTKVKVADEFGHYDDAWAIDFLVDGNIYKELKENDLNGPETGNFALDSLRFPKLMKGVK